MGKWKGRTPEQKAARKLRVREHNRNYQRRHNLNGLRPHGSRPPGPYVDPELIREASNAYARRSSVAELLGDPPPLRDAWTKMTPEQRAKFI